MGKKANRFFRYSALVLICFLAGKISFAQSGKFTFAQDKSSSSVATAPTSAVVSQPEKVAEVAAATSPISSPVLRIGVVSPMMKMVETSQAAHTSDAIRIMLIQYMNGPRAEIVPLEARIPAHVEPEAASKHCNFILYSTVILKKSGGTSRMGGTLKRLAPAAALIALSHGSTSNVVATATKVAMEVMGEVTSEIKKKDEITLEYRLVTIGGSLPLIQDKYYDRAKEEGEDVLTEMIVKTAESVVIASLRGHNEELAKKKVQETTPKDEHIAAAITQPPTNP